MRLLLILAFFGMAVSTMAQSGLQYFSKSNKKSLDTISIDKSSALAKEAEGLLFEPINPDQYKVGPGDSFLVSIINSNLDPIQYTTVVTPEGKLILSGVGVIDIKGLSLTDSYNKATKKISSVFNTPDIDIVLQDIRKFKVTINGKVVSQTVVPSYATERVYEAINKVGGLTEQASIRNIELYRDGEKIIVDLPRYTYLREENANPYLEGGDRIYVPPSDEINIISVQGEVLNPGQYEYKNGDELGHLIMFSKGFTSIALTDSVELYRFDYKTGNVNKSIINLSEMKDSPSWNMPLHSGDRINIRRYNDYYKGDYVVISGEVKKPGKYELTDELQTLQNLFLLCGGTTGDASLENAILYRRKNTSFWDPEMARLSVMSPSEMSDFEKHYFYSRINETYGALSLDMTSISDSDFDVKLTHLDSIHIPGINRYVNVQGRVKNPGLIKFKSGEGYEYYINEAGGYSSDADDTEIIISKNDGSKFYAENEEYIIEIGDNILVPPEQPIDSEQLITNIIAISAQVLAIVSIGLSLSTR